ncbi:Mannan endo-1,4-beta-mannosidase [Bertholletia excelsa]
MLGKKALNSINIFVLALAVAAAVAAGGSGEEQPLQGFVKTGGTHFVRNGRRVYVSGFNAYWMMYMASDNSTRPLVSSALAQASMRGLKLARTWAFSDGPSYRSLQPFPGSYNEQVFEGLDYVIWEAGKQGISVILSLVNNWEDYGGKRQYVQWARGRGQPLNSDDDFFTNPLVKSFFKNHITTVLTRVNTLTGVAYKDDPAIFAWELMNEPRSQTDLSGRSIQEWIKEMAGHVKSVDKNHMLEIGLEGFYGEAMAEKKQFNPGYQVGTDFISNNQIPAIDFSTIHLYPDQWIAGGGSNEGEAAAFVDRWIQAHINDSERVLGKPLILAEFGKSSRSAGYSVSSRDEYFQHIYDLIYDSARADGPCGGELFWQLMPPGMDSFRDGYEVVFQENPSTSDLIAQEARKLSALST